MMPMMRHPLAGEISSKDLLTSEGRQNSEALRYAEKVFSMYGMVPSEHGGQPDDAFSNDSGYQRSEISCAGHCNLNTNW